MNEQLATFFERLAGKAPSQRFLRRLGLDPEQFVLFLGLFRTLSERGEFTGAIGVSRFNISYMALYAAVIGIIPWYGLAVSLPAEIFLIISLLVVFAPTFLVIIREAAISTANHNPDMVSVCHYFWNYIDNGTQRYASIATIG
jgi:hypothetical protein